MLIRPVHHADFDAIAALTNHFIAHTAIHFSYVPLTADELRAAWEKSRATHPYLIAEENGALAGYAKAGVWRDRAAYQWSAEAGVYVDPGLQRRGVGRALYEAVIDDCRRRGFHSLIGGITLPNEASVRLHEACGFRHVGTVQSAGWKMGAWHDVGFWQLLLRDDSHRPTD